MVDAAVNFDKFEADKNSTWPGASIPNKAQSNPGGRHQQQQLLNRMFLDHLVLQRGVDLNAPSKPGGASTRGGCLLLANLA
ncbi:hypothetical protein BSKO_07105 [Bryopsis sp. KO-2023]|nr:hypothetical protein BSKO_07105 [Bryopsis sp. KO-2023]